MVGGFSKKATQQNSRACASGFLKPPNCVVRVQGVGFTVLGLGLGIFPHIQRTYFGRGVLNKDCRILDPILRSMVFLEASILRFRIWS